MENMNMKLRSLTARGLCLALLGALLLTGCASEMTYAPADPPAVTLPDLSDDRKMQDDVLHLYEEHLETVFSEASPVSPDALTYTVNQDTQGITLTGYTGDETVVVLPDSIDGLPVTVIDENAFANQENLCALYIPDSVTVIGFGALKDCNALETLRTPVIEVQDHPYFGALFGAASYEINASEVPDSLTAVILGESIQSIPPYAFYDCNSITCVSLPKTLTAVEKFAFRSCSSLEYLNLADTSLQSVGTRALTDCMALLRFDLPATVTSIGEGVLEGCGSLSAMTLPFVGGTAAENTYLGYLFGAASYTFTAGFVPASLQEIILLEGCTSIPSNAFFEVSCLSRITIPETVTSIGLRAFYGCKKLLSVKLPDSVTGIGDDAFHGCIRLQSVDFGSGLSSIGVQAFMDCLYLKSAALPQGVTRIPNSCFSGCISLETVTAPGVTSADNVGLQAYRHCDKLTDAPFMPVETQAEK